MSNVNTLLPPGGRVLYQPAITMDWTATILAAAGVEADPNYPLDGIDLLPALRDIVQPKLVSGHPSPETRHPAPDTRSFFWRNGNQDAVVRGPWKYLNDGTREYLFNLSVDQREQADFREQNPEGFNQLKSAFKVWESTVLPRPPSRAR